VARPEKLPQPLRSQGAQRFIEFGEHLAGMIARPVGRYLQQALGLFERTGGQDAVAATLANLGIVAARTGQADQAVLYLVRALGVTDPQHQQFDGLIRELGNVRTQVGGEQFGGLMLNAVAASGHDEGWFLDRLRSANLGPAGADDRDVGAPETPGGPPKTPPNPPPGGLGESGNDDDDSQIINIWIGERINNPTVPLKGALLDGRADVPVPEPLRPDNRRRQPDRVGHADLPLRVKGRRPMLHPVISRRDRANLIQQLPRVQYP